MAEKKLSKKALSKSFRNWYYGHLTCFSQEHMQTFGYLCAMLPLIEELYDTKEEQKEALQTYSAFFNTEPQLGTVVVGMTAGLEEARANGEGIDGEMINGIRAGLMGPVAGIGDSLVVGTLIPILLGIALGLSSGGSPLGAIFYIIVYNLVLTLGMRFLYYKGYELGGKAVEMIVGEKSNAIRESIIMLGTIVINVDFHYNTDDAPRRYFLAGRRSRYHLPAFAPVCRGYVLLLAHEQEKNVSDCRNADLGCCCVCRCFGWILRPAAVLLSSQRSLSYFLTLQKEPLAHPAAPSS